MQQSSKKYQAIEKEKMREIKDRERKFGKERSLFLSIQTSQRQKAMEDKKRAMAEAEEERRRKALEDRRQSQQQATDRFRSAMGRVKFSKPTIAGRKFNLPVKSKGSGCSYLPKSSVGMFEMEPRIEVKYKDQNQTEAERLAMGKEVEIVPRDVESPASFRKSSSLDAVFTPVEGSETQSFGSAQQNLVERCDEAGFNGDRRKSASDSNLNQTETQLKPQHNFLESHEAAVFYPSARSLPAPVSKHSQLEITAVSPTPMCKISGIEQSVVEDEFCNSPSVPDSLNSSLAESNPEFKSGVPIHSEDSATPSLYYKEHFVEKNYEELPSAEESDASVTDSLEESSSNISPSKPKVHDSQGPNSVASKQPVIGILKKGNKSASTPLMNFYRRSRFNSLPQDISNGNKNVSGDPSQVSRVSQKRVRFSDQVEVNVKNTSPLVMNISDPVQIELWKKVFPKEFSPQPVPNSAFTPKLRCSLSSKTASFQGMYRTSRRPISNVAPPAARSENYHGLNTNTEKLDPSQSDSGGGQAGIEFRNRLDIEDEHVALQSLDKTPTDAEINTMWDQIRQCLQDGRKVSVPPRLFNFKPPLENGRRILANHSRPVSLNADTSTSTNSKSPASSRTYGSTTSSGNPRNLMNYTTQKHLVYRQPNQARFRSHSDDVHPHLSRVATQYALPVEKEPLQLKNRMQSTIQPSSREPSKSVASYDVSVTNLSLEEQRLMQSIERINQRLKDHLQAPGASELKTQYYYPVPPSTVPKRHSTPSQRMRGPAEAKPGARGS